MNTSFKRKLILFIKKMIDGIILLVGIITMEKAYESTGKITVILLILIVAICLFLLNHYIFLKK
ncbi:hypothetical protein [Caldisalinibacter kiritimatiensis]|uniref:Uncharacterized protein n=1 Tax=Caldisalinibacter kiritimatiensis TaxID=1304284 RepID=R1CD90_9FIRM|nr:hypothetical protein [Caldisalinibacter kiritimatiensis]EOD00265.1 hypothetical protein L21TH_1692 [Caldisalinibacter kiritimatiensis]